MPLVCHSISPQAVIHPNCGKAASIDRILTHENRERVCRYCENTPLQQAERPGPAAHRNGMVRTYAVCKVDSPLIRDDRINTLPVTNDEEAAPYAYGYLVELIEQ